MNEFCKAEEEVVVGIAGVDGLRGDDHYELITCGRPATVLVTYRDELDDDPHHNTTTEAVCDGHAAMLRDYARTGFLTVLSEAPLSAV